MAGGQQGGAGEEADSCRDALECPPRLCWPPFALRSFVLMLIRSRRATLPGTSRSVYRSPQSLTYRP